MCSALLILLATSPATRGPEPVINPLGVSTLPPIYRVGSSLGCLPAGLGDAGCVSVTDQQWTGKKTMDRIDAGALMCSTFDGQNTVAPLKMTAHNGASTFDNAFVWDVQPANTRTVDTYAWENGTVQGMGLDLSTATYSSPTATPRLNVYGYVSPYGIDNRSSGSTRTIQFTSNLSGAAGTTAVDFNQTNARTSGTCQYTMSNAGTVYACFEPNSSFSQELGQLAVTGRISAAGDTSHGAFQVIQNGSGTVAVECSDTGNGCYVPVECHETGNANLHGCLVARNGAYLDGGLLINAVNPGNAGYTAGGNNDNVFTVDFNGGFGQPLRAQTYAAGIHQFYPCPDPSPPINSFGHGSAASLLNWASDTSHYYVCKTGDLPDAGNTGYKQMAERNPVWLPPILVNTALVGGATLGAFVVPDDNPVDLNFVQFYVSSPGSGGSTNATIRATNSGGGTCDFSFACNASAGPKHVTGSGLGCTNGLRSDTFTFTAQTIGNCSPGPTLAGNLAPEGYWR